LTELRQTSCSLGYQDVIILFFIFIFVPFVNL